MLFPDRSLEQVEPLQHPEAEASEVVEVADPPEAEQLHLLQEEQELPRPELLQPELLQLEPLQLEPLQEQQPEEVPQELQVQPVNLLQSVEQPVHLREQKLMLPQVRNQILPRIQLSPVEPQRTREQRMAETMQRNRVKP